MQLPRSIVIAESPRGYIEKAVEGFTFDAVIEEQIKIFWAGDGPPPS
jgi:hypothetical protein